MPVSQNTNPRNSRIMVVFVGKGNFTFLPQSLPSGDKQYTPRTRAKENMGATCCKQGKAAEEVFTTDNLNCKLVRERGTEFNETYEVVEVIGEGSISTISKIRRKVAETAQESPEVSTVPDQYYAVKEINTLIVDPTVVAEMENEIDLLKRLVRYLIFLPRNNI